MNELNRNQLETLAYWQTRIIEEANREIVWATHKLHEAKNKLAQINSQLQLFPPKRI